MFPGTIQWRWNDISNAICLHASGPRAYSHRYKKRFPLQHVTTFQRCCRNLDEGILKKSHEEKLCVLSFDEIKVMEFYEYYAVGDMVKKPANFPMVCDLGPTKRKLRKDVDVTTSYIDFPIKNGKI